MFRRAVVDGKAMPPSPGTPAAPSPAPSSTRAPSESPPETAGCARAGTANNAADAITIDDRLPFIRTPLNRGCAIGRRSGSVDQKLGGQRVRRRDSKGDPFIPRAAFWNAELEVIPGHGHRAIVQCQRAMDRSELRGAEPSRQGMADLAHARAPVAHDRAGNLLG